MADLEKIENMSNLADLVHLYDFNIWLDDLRQDGHLLNITVHYLMRLINYLITFDINTLLRRL